MEDQGLDPGQLDAMEQGITPAQLHELARPTNPSGGLSPSQLDALDKGFKLSKVTFIPHDYDMQIEGASKKFPDVSTDLLRGVGMQESGLGHSAAYDPATGLSRDPTNQGHGLFQLDPASGASAADLQRASSNPGFAADRAAQMLHANLQKYGTIRAALAAYNSGSPDSEKGLAYADAVLARLPTLDPIRLAQAKTKPQGSAAVQAHLAGIGDLGQIKKTIQAPYFNVNDAYVHGKESADWIRRHPVEALGNALGSLQRPVDALATDLINGDWTHPWQTLSHVGHAIMHPEDNQKIVDALETAIAHKMGFPDFKAEQMHGIGKFIADLATETATDPLTYIPVVDFFSVGGRAVKLLAAATHSKEAVAAAIKAMGPIANTPPMRKLLSRMDGYVKASSNLVDTAGKKFKALGERRPELNNYMTDAGKHARMGIESAANYHMSRRSAENAAILRRYAHELKGLKYGDQVPAEVQRHQLMEAWKYGDAQARQEAEHLLNALHMSPTVEERKLFPKPKGYLHYEGPLQENYVSKIIPKSNQAKHFDEKTQKIIEWMNGKAKEIKMPFVKPHTQQIPPHLKDFSMYDLIANRMHLGNEVVRRQQVAHETANLYRQYGTTVFKGAPAADDSVLPEWIAKNIPDRSGYAKFSDKDFQQGLRSVSDMFKVGILGNPIPHGLINVGTVTLFRSNPYVAGRGILYALKGVPKNIDERLDAMGGKTSYWRDPSSVPFTIPKAFEASQAILDRLETGYRASYLQYLDKLQGVLPKDDPQYLLKELQKGQQVNLDIGDYQNPTKLAGMMKAIGGLFDVFRLDVVPRAGMAAIKGRTGQTINLLQRAQTDFSTQFMPSGESLELFGPLGDFARMISGAGTLDYMTSTATLGPALGGVVQAEKSEAGGYVSSLAQDLGWIGNYIIPGLGSGLKMVDQYNDAPGWVKFWLEALGGGYTKHEPSPRTEKRRAKTYDRAAGQ